MPTPSIGPKLCESTPARKAFEAPLGPRFLSSSTPAASSSERKTRKCWMARFTTQATEEEMSRRPTLSQMSKGSPMSVVPTITMAMKKSCMKMATVRMPALTLELICRARLGLSSPAGGASAIVSSCQAKAAAVATTARISARFIHQDGRPYLPGPGLPPSSSALNCATKMSKPTMGSPRAGTAACSMASWTGPGLKRRIITLISESNASK
mmetsp:Transcript_35823/g.83337  ORF Transcript_35823/g.83337 Transcript_35823/m.83337 type:complete len:211 (+) Transcript_35823:826-1458(+)